MKQARETKAGRAVSAWVIVNNKGEFIGKVNAVRMDSGAVYVDFWHRNSDKWSLQQYHASGGGYDKVGWGMAQFDFMGEKLPDGDCWEQTIEDKGFRVYQAI